MKISRREMVTLMGMTAASTLVGNGFTSAGAQASPSPRMPLDEFVQSASLLAALRRGVAEMKRRKPSDPLSWFYQAAIHGVTDEAVKEAAKIDPDVANIPAGRWNQCPHNGENSANFLPWHRGYTYYFEKILRMHTGESSLSLPYWNYHDRANRKFPREFGIEHLDGNLQNNAPENINPLFMAQRDFYFCTYEHPFATGLPLLELADSAVDISLPMASPVFFGATEQEGLGGGILDADGRTRGLLESYPHDHLHRSVGGIVITPDGRAVTGAMAQPPTAGFDPIFPIHHANIDRLWAEWSCMPGKEWGTLPPATWFNEAPWFFFDVDGKEVNEPRKKYFDHRALGVRFKYEDISCSPLQLPESVTAGSVALRAERAPVVARRAQTLATSATPFVAPSARRSIIPVAEPAKQRLRAPATSFRSRLRAAENRAGAIPAEGRIFLRLLNIDLESLQATGFDVHVTTNPQVALSRADASFVGSIALFNHPPSHAKDHGGGGEGQSQSFDITRAVAAAGDQNLSGLSVVLVPFPLLTSPNRETIFLGTNAIRVGGFEFFIRQ